MCNTSHILPHFTILKMCCFITTLCVFIARHSRVIVHLQAPSPVPSDLFFFLFFSAAPAASAAAAAVSAAEPQRHGDHSVPWCQGAQRAWQEVPVVEELGQKARAARLHHIDDDNNDDQHNDGHADADQDLPASQGQAEHTQRQHQEAQDEVEAGKPSVFGRLVPQPSG